MSNWVNSINKNGSTSKLVSYNTTKLPDHSCVYVTTVKDTFRLEKTSTLTADGYTVVQPNSGSGRWIREFKSSPDWAQQNTWYIDPIFGGDENDGYTSITALKTHEEFRHRVGKNVIKQATIVHVLNDLPPTDPFIIDSESIYLRDSGFVPLTYVGTKTQVASGTFSSFTPRVTSTNTPNQGTSSLISNWDGYVGGGYLVVMTSGSALGAVAYVAKNLGGGAARFSSFYDQNAIVEKTPSSSDSFIIVRVTKIPFYFIAPVPSTIVYKNLYFQVNFNSSPAPAIGLIGAVAGTSTSFYECIFDTHLNTSSYMIYSNCGFLGTQNSFESCIASLNAGIVIGDPVNYSGTDFFCAAGCDVSFTDGTLFEKVSLDVTNGAYVRIYDAGFFDAPTGRPAISVVTEGRARFQIVWGAGAATFGCVLDMSGKVGLFAGAGAVTVTGGVGDVSINGTTQPWGLMPFIDQNSEASVIVPGLSPVNQVGGGGGGGSSGNSGIVITQPHWYIDPINGNDGYSGLDALHPLKTDAERQRRWGIASKVSIGVDIHYLNDVPTSDPFNLDVWIGKDGYINVYGTPVVTRTSTFTAVTALNRNANQCLEVTDGSFNWSAQIGKQVYIPSGARAGSHAWVAKSISSGVARLSPMDTLPINELHADLISSHVTPVNGDTYQLRTLTQLPTGLVIINIATSVYSDAQNVNFTDLHLLGTFGNNGSITSPAFFPIYHSRCWLDGIVLNGDVHLIQGCRLSTVTILGGIATCLSGLVDHYIFTGVSPNINLDGDILFQGLTASAMQAGYIFLANVAMFDSSSDGMALGADSQIITGPFIFGGDLLWGTNNAGHGVSVSYDNKFAYTTRPTINAGLGMGREVSIGGVEMLWSDVPYINDSSQSSVVAI